MKLHKIKKLWIYLVRAALIFFFCICYQSAFLGLRFFTVFGAFGTSPCSESDLFSASDWLASSTRSSFISSSG